MLDDSLLGVANAAAGLADGGTVIVNTTRLAGELGLPASAHVVTSDVTGAAQAADLIVGGQPMVSTAILGAVAAATGLITMQSVRDAIGHAFSGKAAEKNLEAAKIAFDCTKG